MIESNLKCFIISQATEYEIHSTAKPVQITLHTRDSITSVYNVQWWLTEVSDISDINKDELVTFYHPVEPRTDFKKKEKNQTSVPMNNVSRKLKCLRTYNTWNLQQLTTMEGYIRFP